MSDFDPSTTASYKAGLFGIPTNLETAKIVLIPVPWDVTTSYGGGTSEGPQAILEASAQVDLFDRQLKKSYEAGYHLLPISKEIRDLNHKLRPVTLQIRDQLETTGHITQSSLVKEVNDGCIKMYNWVLNKRI